MNYYAIIVKTGSLQSKNQEVFSYLMGSQETFDCLPSDNIHQRWLKENLVLMPYFFEAITKEFEKDIEPIVIQFKEKPDDAVLKHIFNSVNTFQESDYYINLSSARRKVIGDIECNSIKLFELIDKQEVKLIKEIRSVK